MMESVSLFGYGKTTKSLAKVIKTKRVFFDDSFTEPFIDENGFTIQPSDMFDSENSSLEIPSPGIPPSNPMIKKAKHLISEYDYFADTKPLKIWISGTNGKTTTTQMLQHLLKDKGATAGGNIGTPLAELDQNAPVWILETSSFSMHYTNKAYPNIYLLLPITPDHLSWHGGMKQYVDAKLKPLKMMSNGDTAIIPKEYKNTPTDAKTITYESADELAGIFGIDTKKIKFKAAFLFDAIMAMCADKILYGRINYDKINSFEIEPHRQEEIRDSKNRLWVNDTKATNLDATIAAVKRYEDNFIHLILGGDDKGVDLSELFEFLKNKDIKIYAIGSNKNRLIKLSREYGIQNSLCKNLQDAIGKIDKELSKIQTALLSPAAASLDEFKSYAHRGEMFKREVEKL